MDAVVETVAQHGKRDWLAVSRKRAFLTHLCLSSTVVAAVLALAFFVWYPHPYFEAMGTWSPLRVLVAVDVVLGPLLTLIVFKPGKPGLKFDLAFIAVVQLAALIYGVTLLYRERPYVTVFAVDRFQVLASSEVPPFDAERLGGKPLAGVLLVSAEPPEDGEAAKQLMFEVLGGRPDIDRRPELWRPYADGTADVIARARPLAELVASEGPEAASAVARLLDRLGRSEDELGYLPLLVKDRHITAVVDLESAMPIEVLEVDPWPAVN